MMWWQVVLIFMGLCIAGVLLGFFIGYLILRKKKRQWPYAWPFKNHKTIVTYEVPVAAVSVPVAPLPERHVTPAIHTWNDPGRLAVKSQPAISTEPAVPRKSDFREEIEKNLAIATAPWTGKLESFQTRVLEANRTIVESLPPELQEDIREAYTDMRLANTLVWLSMDVGHRSKDLDESYLKLSNKIAERLQKSMPSLNRAGV
jgi:hypothetical protein